MDKKLGQTSEFMISLSKEKKSMESTRKSESRTKGNRSGRKTKRDLQENDGIEDEFPVGLPSRDYSTRSACFFDPNSRGINLNSECDSEPDRSDPPWKVSGNEKICETSKLGVEPDSDYKKLTLWDEIMMEYEDKRLELHNLRELKKPFEPPLPVCAKLSAVQYLEKHIFSILCPALEETLFKATELDCLTIQKCRFNGLDYIAELLWNRNPLHPKRHHKHLEIFDIPFVTICLHYNPRPIYPLSWVWSKEEAIIVLQSYIRRYLVCKEPDCSEMRQFWKMLKSERDVKKRCEMEKCIEELDIFFNEILDKLVADAVFDSEWKIYGCKCIKKPCQCVCKCKKWCNCCNCYKVRSHDKAPCDCKKMEFKK